MTIDTLREMTRDQLLDNPPVLREVTFNTLKTQVTLKDGTFTVGSLIKLSGNTAGSWGA